MKWNDLYDMAMGYVVPDRPLILSADDYSNVVHDEAYIGETGPARLSYGPTSIMFWHKPGVIYGHELLEALDDIVNNYHSGEKDVFVSWFMVRSRKGLFGVSKTKPRHVRPLAAPRSPRPPAAHTASGRLPTS